MTRPFLGYPFAVDGRGRTATTDPADHLRDLIVQLLLTDPGERVNRPDFGCGVRRLVFMPNSGALAAATQTMVRASLQVYLQDDLIVVDVQAEARDELLLVTVLYALRAGGAVQSVQAAVPSPGSRP
jgi:uncharacterized protein